jgi:hypothetical protein
MTSRMYQVHIGLFLAVYVACLVQFWASSGSTPALPGFTHGILSQQTDSASHSATDNSQSAIQSVSAQQQPLDKDADARSKEQLEPTTPLESTNALSEETRKEVSELSVQATSASEPRERANAIVKLRNAARTDESVQALLGVLTADQSGQNRMFAIASLVNMAKQGDEGGVIRAALHRAAVDEDPRVVTRAQQALQTLSDVQVAAD